LKLQRAVSENENMSTSMCKEGFYLFVVIEIIPKLLRTFWNYPCVYVYGREVDGTGSVSCPMMDTGSSNVEPSGPTTTKLII
jgi:hypothetical protein